MNRNNSHHLRRRLRRIRKFFSYYRPYRGLLALDLACAFVVSAVTLALPLLTRYITGVVLAGPGLHAPATLHTLYAFGAGTLGLIALYTVCNVFVDSRGHAMGAMMERDMRAELFAHYEKLSFRFYDRERVARLMTRLTSDLLSLAELYHHGPEDISISLFKLAGSFAILFSINPRLTLALSVFVPVMALYAVLTGRRMNRTLRACNERIGDINARAEDTLAGIRVVQSFANEEIEARKFAAANNRFLESRARGYRSEALCYTVLESFTQLITASVIVLGGAAIAGGTLTLPDLLAFLLCVSFLIEPALKLVNFLRLWKEGSVAFGRFMEILEIEPDIADRPGARPLRHVEGDIAFRRVRFRYQEDTGEVLSDLSLHIRAGEHLALVGPSGAGKTTLCSLIPRFYDVSAGAVLLDGRDIRDFTLPSLRGAIGMVQQDVYLFDGTVEENILYGRPGAAHDQVVEAAKKANAHEFILRLPHGYDTEIGQRGVRLSGGQRQRLSIARVFLKDPPVLIFDEATSALDNESERAIQDSTERLMRGRTTLVIAHRLSTVRSADRIVVLTEGGIAEEGTHDELMRRRGAYAALYNSQARL